MALISKINDALSDLVTIRHDAHAPEHGEPSELNVAFTSAGLRHDDICSGMVERHSTSECYQHIVDYTLHYELGNDGNSDVMHRLMISLDDTVGPLNCAVGNIANVSDTSLMIGTNKKLCMCKYVDTRMYWIVVYSDLCGMKNTLFDDTHSDRICSSIGHASTNQKHTIVPLHYNMQLDCYVVHNNSGNLTINACDNCDNHAPIAVVASVGLFGMGIGMYIHPLMGQSTTIKTELQTSSIHRLTIIYTQLLRGVCIVIMYPLVCHSL